MAKLEKIEKKVQQYFLAEEERLISQGEESRLEYFRKMQEKSEELFARFAHHKVFEDRSLRAVVGFGEDGVPRYWNPKEGNLLVCGPASGGFVAQGNLLALLSLCRFSEEELHWFDVARESASGFLRRMTIAEGTARSGGETAAKRLHRSALKSIKGWRCRRNCSKNSRTSS